MMLSLQVIILFVCPLAFADWDVYTAKIFKLHNEYRQKILNCEVDGQPAAKRMPQLIWDTELASQAKSLSKTCELRVQRPKSRRFHLVGQNVGTCTSVEK
ncbi:unnamed protein product [Trichobilharzia regenti]|nr:unnamed protein product [Trichobilharzia regenti]